MKPDLIPVFLLLPLAALILWLVTRYRAADSRPGRLGYAAAGRGLAGFVLALLAPVFASPDRAPVLAAAGGLTLLFAVTAVVLAVWAFRVLRQEPRGALLYPVLGLLCGAANLFCGAGIVATGSGGLVPTGGTPRTWRSEEHGFGLTLPSERWQQRPNSNAVAYFTCPRPLTMALVGEIHPATTDAEFAAAVAHGQKIRDATPGVDPDERSGQNSHGHSYWMSVGEVKAKDGPYVLGVSVTGVGDRAVLMMTEGQFRLSSEAGRAQERAALRAEAVQFLSSVE